MPTPAWIQVIEKRLSLRCQQCQQRFPQCTGKGRSEHCRRLRPKPAILFGGQAQLRWDLCVVPLVRVLDLSPDCGSTPGVMLRWLGLFLVARAPSPTLSPIFIF